MENPWKASIFRWFSHWNVHFFRGLSRKPVICRAWGILMALHGHSICLEDGWSGLAGNCLCWRWSVSIEGNICFRNLIVSVYIYYNSKNVCNKHTHIYIYIGCSCKYGHHRFLPGLAGFTGHETSQFQKTLYISVLYVLFMYRCSSKEKLRLQPRKPRFLQKKKDETVCSGGSMRDTPLFCKILTCKCRGDVFYQKGFI